MGKEIMKQIDVAIKSIWLNEIPKDYAGKYLMKEDSLKSAFYHHLRSSSLAEILDENDLRIFTEFNDADIKKSRFCVDMAIVKVPKHFTGYMGEAIKEEDILAIIEFKYKAARQAGIDAGFYDVEKLKHLIQQDRYRNCQYYLCGIYESWFDTSELTFLGKKQTNNWANGCVTELTACYINGFEDLRFFNVSYNNLNLRLNRDAKNATSAGFGV
ncbi:hypothetical protein Sgly_1156 [Syntrophobotulus glycolicus DSM 8271]|uniref:Uncharacterized protein n=1 Tax=Syntrophobotulus glycolicus (strain DSM 8271 / FlGlyR) TaxID=645991 RepID=F0SUI4_SYNGF|nr:hypothetical protein [Syntrophobotulus glycolicus]ADY55477.1 hypothetical protein Sgly_1156 [Syntrophobotulus glycolicus DSM 8271]